jgi:glycosyltransferase involved in cell wall biosynthesis
MESANPLVSVVVLAFNVEPYIAQALEGILAQKAPFEYEIVVGEDCSTDGTGKILASYAKRHPERFKPVWHEHNVGMVPNFLDALNACTGKYIAVCDADDYWTDPGKLRKQVEFLESHPAHGLVFTDADVYYEAENMFVRAYDNRVRKAVPQGEVFSSLMYGPNPYRVATSCFRSSLLADYKQIITMRDFYVNDFPLWMSLARQALVGYIPESTAVYRIRACSMSHFGTLEEVIRFRRAKYKTCLFLAERYGMKPDVKRLRRKYLRDVIGECAQRRDLTMLRRYTGSLVLGLMIITRQYLVEFAYR